MGLDIFFVENIRNALVAASKAGLATARVCAAEGSDPVVLHAYLEGYRAALTTVALAFGLEPSIISGQGNTLEVEAWMVGEPSPVVNHLKGSSHV